MHNSFQEAFTRKQAVCYCCEMVRLLFETVTGEFANVLDTFAP